MAFCASASSSISTNPKFVVVPTSSPARSPSAMMPASRNAEPSAVYSTNFIDALRLFEADDKTEAIVLIGEIGGTDEEEAAAFIKESVSKPVVAFVAGRTAPPGKRMGHAGAIISGGTGTAKEKIEAFESCNVPVAGTPAEISEIVAKLLSKKNQQKLEKAC